MTIDLTDDELISAIVSDQLTAIKLQKLYQDNPMACPVLLQVARRLQDVQWSEALRRELHLTIHQIVKEQNKL